MTFTLFSGRARQICAVAALLACGQAQATTLLNSSYNVARELFVALNPGFIAQWQQEHPGDKLTLRQSYAGSSWQAMAILQGFPADVVTYNQVTDVQILHDRGQLIAADWRDRLPNQSSPYYSTMAFLVRKGNPKGIHDWHDLARDCVQLVFPNSETSGNRRYRAGVWRRPRAPGCRNFWPTSRCSIPGGVAQRRPSSNAVRGMC